MARILFDYECLDCSNKFEELIYTDRPDTTTCPECKSDYVTRLISAPRIDPKLGTDPEGFPTMGDKWAKKHRIKPSTD